MFTPGGAAISSRHNGAGEMLVFSAADFEDFLEPRRTSRRAWSDELERVVRHLVEHRWPFRLHATHNESISRMLDVFEKVNRDIPFNGLQLVLRPHAETVTRANIDRIKALGGGIAVQHPYGLPGRVFLPSVTASKPPATPPVAKCSRPACRWGLGTDATRVASYNPWTALYWLVLRSYRRRDADVRSQRARLDRDTALMLWTRGRAWFSSEQNQKGQIKVSQLADRRCSAKITRVPEEEIMGIESRPHRGERRYRHARRHLCPTRAAGHSGPARVVPLVVRCTTAARRHQAARVGMSVVHHCSGPMRVHSHQHDFARTSAMPVSDDNAFWGRWAAAALHSDETK